MNTVRSRLVLGHIALLAVGGIVGMLYGHADWGVLAAALIAVVWHVRQLLIFERALRTKDFEQIRYGRGIWSHIHSQFSFLRNRSKQHKKNYRRLIKEIRKSANALPDGGIVLNENFEIILCKFGCKKTRGTPAPPGSRSTCR